MHHTLVVSDIHLTEAEPPHPHIPLWKRFKHRDFFVDDLFSLFLERMCREINEPCELVLNGDIFDFDSVMALPKDGRFHLSFLERLRGMAAEEPKSRFKMELILSDHPVWVDALRKFIRAGNSVVFVLGNHDIELHWPSVQTTIRERLELTPEEDERVRFVEWFYISNSDTLLEHGNQYDSYCLCANPIHPTIRKNRKEVMRLPFGNQANKFMVNGMGLFNAHVQDNVIMSFTEYLRFFTKYLWRTQPLIIWTWFWGACVTLINSIHEGLLPAARDPLMVEERVEGIAERASATPKIVRQLFEIRAHPASHDPVRIIRELWLDRALLLGLGLFLSFQFFSFINVFVSISIAWVLIPVATFLPFFLFYARSVKPEVPTGDQAPDEAIEWSARIAGVNRVVHGHTHFEIHAECRGIEVFNTGSWSPAFRDIECKKPFGRKPFVWIRPVEPGSRERVAALYHWQDGGYAVIPKVEEIDRGGKKQKKANTRAHEFDKSELAEA